MSHHIGAIASIPNTYPTLAHVPLAARVRVLGTLQTREHANFTSYDANATSVRSTEWVPAHLR